MFEVGKASAVEKAILMMQRRSRVPENLERDGNCTG